MAIRGSLREASLPDVLQLLAMGQKTGCLSITHKQAFGYIYFDRGRISFASIVNRRDRLGDLLVKNGLIARQALDDAIAEQATRRETRLGDLLVERNLLAREQLHGYIRLQIEEAVYFLFTWTQGTFNFEADVRPEEDFLVSINPQSLLLEGARRVDEWSLIEKKIPSFDLIFALHADRLRESAVELTSEQEALVPLLDGARDVAALIDESGLGEFDVGKALYGLLTAGFLHRVGKSRTAEPAVSESRVAEHRNLGVAFYKAAMLDEATREFRRVLELSPGDELATFYSGLVLLRAERWAEAAELFAHAADRPGASPAVRHNLAYALERLGRFEEATGVLSTIIEHAPACDPRTRLSLVVLALRRADLETARQELAAAAAAWGARARPAAWYHFAGLAAALAGELDAAIAVLTEGTAVHPHAAVLHNNLAAALERRGRHAESAAAAERGTLEDPTLPQLHKNVGDHLYRAGRYDEALDAYQRAIRHHPALGSDVFLKVGNIRYRRLERNDAIQSWERALELEPANAIARANLETARRAT